jgi:hypothetical protein
VGAAPCPTLAPPAAGSRPLSSPLDREDALRVLELSSADDERAVKRAYRRLARAHHPDLGGEVAVFHELQQAYETLVGDGSAAPPVTPPGRPSRARDDWDAHRAGPRRNPVDLDGVDWDAPLPDGPVTLSVELAARWLAAGLAAGLVGTAEHGDGSAAPPQRLVGTSRAPGSRLNRAAPRLSADLTATLDAGPGRDDRGRAVVAIEIRAGNRRARRALDRVGLAGGWVRRRGSATTALRRALPTAADPRATALRAVGELEDLLVRMDWPLSAWTATTR